MNKNKKKVLHSSAKNVLLRSNNTEQIKQYFEKVLQLVGSGEQFPVDFNEVWPLAYSEKSNAVRVLKSDFIENEDYILLAQNDEQKKRGGHNRVDYHLSVKCLEYFIAKKVKPVFEVYRKVFHASVQNGNLIAGVAPVEIAGKLLYPYNDILKACGYSLQSGSYTARRRNYPSEFTYNEQWYVCRAYANVIYTNKQLIVERKAAKERSVGMLAAEKVTQLKLALLPYICRIENNDLRNNIVNELTGGCNHGNI